MWLEKLNRVVTLTQIIHVKIFGFTLFMALELFSSVL